MSELRETLEIVDERTFAEVAVVASRLHWDARMGERDLSGEYAITDVFVRGGRRRCAAWRVSTRLTEGAA